MHFTLPSTVSKTFKYSLLLFTCSTLFSCQPKTEEATSAAAGTEAPAEAAVAAVEPRPAPDFFYVPQEMMEKRVWICEDGVADIFHVQHDCPVLLECKGKGSFRNLPLIKAIETYGRYNCLVCSEDLGHIFDEDAVRDM
ncbi:hypothetical protein CLV24_12930 [Pontibacter ummariensis]|uniref:Uncharacterized protein n=1 Tax=Pontibacter ummariensis TaxID=1610492 RepID=A0A239KKB7_9BACT|nr:hypothetical protein [Pontibacter ummariensis]PRY05713.1 hypothetical protein CLV24_12930 [Pontibacter ummariensis]SNT18132.1 hypothetical protein SAMN06296052_12928 [Pontibacter ummariensis]